MGKTVVASRSLKALFSVALGAGLMLPTSAALAKTSGTDVDDAQFVLAGVQAGDKVTAYQIFDTDIDAQNNLTYTMKVSGLPGAYDTLEEIQAADGRAVADAISAQVIASSAKRVEATADESGKATLTLDSGYYLVVVTSNSGNTKVYQTLLVDATPDVADGAYVTRQIEETNAKVIDVPAPGKEIISADGSTAGASTDSYSVGDTAKFRITGTIPNYPADATHALYKITDKPDAGLDVSLDSFVVKQGDNALVKDTDYTVVDNGDHTYSINFSQAYILAHPGASISIEYTAVVKSINLETGTVGNKAYGTFNPSPYEEKDVDTDEVDPVDQTYGFSFKKLAAPDNNPLEGAEFTVKDANRNIVTYIDAAGVLHADGVVASGADGWVYVNGLKAGTYTVTESKVPAGYQKVEDFTVTLSADTAKSDTAATPDVTETNFNVSTLDKVDPKVGQLPTTGGAGTIALTAGGVLLVVGGAAAAMRSRKTRKQD